MNKVEKQKTGSTKEINKTTPLNKLLSDHSKLKNNCPTFPQETATKKQRFDHRKNCFIKCPKLPLNLPKFHKPPPSTCERR